MGDAQQHGIALITAMLIAAIVTAGAVALATSQQFSNRRVANILTADQVQLGVRALEQQAQQLLREDATRGQYDAADEAWAQAKLVTTTGDLKLEGRLRDLQGRFNLTNLSPEPAYAGEGSVSAEVPQPTAESTANPPLPAPNGAANTAPPAALPPAAGALAQDGTPLTPAARGEQQLRLLFKALELAPEPVQAILDWIDPDTETRFPNGAEDDYYTEQQPAYRAGNRPLLSVRELLLIKGITAEIYRKLAPFVTCLPRAGRINVNTAPRQVLLSLAPSLDSSAVNILLKARDTQPFLTTDAFIKHPLLQFRQIPADDVTVTSDYFELQSTARNARLDTRMVSLLARSGREVVTLRHWRDNFDE
jgi:general secretion pathway protein K